MKTMMIKMNNASKYYVHTKLNLEDFVKEYFYATVPAPAGYGLKDQELLKKGFIFINDIFSSNNHKFAININNVSAVTEILNG